MRDNFEKEVKPISILHYNSRRLRKIVRKILPIPIWPAPNCRAQSKRTRLLCVFRPFKQ